MTGYQGAYPPPYANQVRVPDGAQNADAGETRTRTSARTFPATGPAWKLQVTERWTVDLPREVGWVPFRWELLADGQLHLTTDDEPVAMACFVEWAKP